VKVRRKGFALIELLVVIAIGINPCLPDWFTALKESPGCGVLMCGRPYPPGWGGNITDSVTQGACGVDFQAGLGTSQYNLDLKASAIDDPVKRFVVGDMGVKLEAYEIANVAYPHTCRLAGSACDYPAGSDPVDPRLGVDSSALESVARHLGGANLGFADGHAKSFPSEVLLFAGEARSACIDSPTLVEDLDSCGMGPANDAALAVLGGG